jgi:hypothetical protein
MDFSESSKVWFHTQFLFENRIKVASRRISNISAPSLHKLVTEHLLGMNFNPIWVKNILIPNVAEKNILILVEEKK